MEITLEAIISLIGLFVGGGSIGGFLFWRQTKRKAKAEAALAEAEAKLKEAEAKQAEVVAVNSMQEAYEKMFANVNAYLEDAQGKVEGLRQERDHYKQDRNELREQLDKMRKDLFDVQGNQALLNRKVESMRPFLCGNLMCKKRTMVAFMENGEVKAAGKKSRKQEPTK